MRKRIEWTEYEQDTLFLAMKKIHADKPKLSLLEMGKLAQVALPEGRQRKYLNSVANFPEYLRKKLVDGGLLSPDWEKGHRKVAKAPDPNELRINQLGEERDAAIQQRDELLEQNKGLSQQLLHMRRELQSIPTEAQVVKTFIADILWDVETRRRALPGPTSEEINKVVAAVKPQEEPRPPRHDPEPESGPRKPKLVLVGGRPNVHARIHNAMKDVADMRYVEHGNQAGWAERFKAYKDPAHGKVVLWTTQAAHQLEEGLKYQNIPFTRVNVPSAESLIDVLKQMAKEQAR